jgi:hypothetical protein
VDVFCSGGPAVTVLEVVSGTDGLGVLGSDRTVSLASLRAFPGLVDGVEEGLLDSPTPGVEMEVVVDVIPSTIIYSFYQTQRCSHPSY